MWVWNGSERSKWCNCHDECNRLTSPISDVQNWILPESERKRNGSSSVSYDQKYTWFLHWPLLPWVCEGKNEEKCSNPWSKLPKDRPSDDAVGNREKYYYDFDLKEDLTTSTSFFLSQESIVGLKQPSRGINRHGHFVWTLMRSLVFFPPF